MKFRKLAVLLLSVLCLMSLASCGGNGGGTGGASESPAGDAEPWKLTYVVSVRDEFLGQLEDAVVAAAAERGVDLEVLYSGNDSLQFSVCVETAANNGRDAVLANLGQSEDAAQVIEAAGDMKVVFINRMPYDESVYSDSVVGIASDENLSGAYQGEYLGEYFNSIGKTDVRYVLLHGTSGLLHTDLRTEGALAKMREAGLTLTEAGRVEGEYDRSTASEGMAALLKDGVEFDCIISNNDAMAIGAILAMKDAGLDPSSVPIVGIDATADGLQEMIDGNMAMTVFQDSRGQAQAGVDAAINLLEGRAVNDGTGYEVDADNEHIIYVPFVPVTPDNLADFTG